MAGVRALRKLQFGREVTAGTGVVATSIWRGKGVISDDHETVFVEADEGILGGTNRAYKPKLAATLNLEEIEATYEQLPHLLEMGIKSVGTGAADGAGTDKIYSYPLSTTAINTLKSYTIEGGDNEEAERMEYCLASKITLKGKGGEAVMMGAEIFGRQVALQAFTGSLALATVETIIFGGGKLYIDAIGGTIGTTLQSNTLLEMGLEINTGVVPVWTIDNKYFSLHKIANPEVVLTLTFEHDTVSKAEKVKWRAGTSSLIQLKFEGSNVATPGTTYSKKTLLANLAGQWEKFAALGDQDGNDVLTGTFRSKYDVTAARWFDLVVVNELASIP